LTHGGGRDAWGDVHFLAPLAGLVCVVVLLSVGSVSTEARFLDSPLLRQVSKTSSFRLKDLRHKNMTIYLCMSVGEMESHYRWLRLIVRQALTALEREGPYPRGKLPILFLMEEFASLGHMPIMEQAAAYFPGFGVKLWAVLQDLGQLKRHYRDSWQTMAGNAGLVQFFATADPPPMTTSRPDWA